MRKRLLLGGLVAALALSVSPAANAQPKVTCAEGFEVICTVIALTCVVTHETPCHP